MSDRATDLSESPDADDEYVVERVVDKKIENGKVYYQIKWLGWPDTDNTWEPIENCAKCENLISQFEEAAAQKKKAYTLANQSSTASSGSTSSNDSTSSSDSDFSAKKRVHFKKKGKKSHKSRRSSKTKCNDSDVGDENKKSKKKASSSTTRNKTTHVDGSANIGFGDTLAMLDQSSSEKSKRSKEARKEHKKSSEYREKEQIKMYLNTGCGSKAKDRTVHEDARKVVSAKSRVESEPSLPVSSKDKHNRKKEHRRNSSKNSKEKISSRNEKLTTLKRPRRISSSSSSENDSYDDRYFGYERNKRLVEIVEWCEYKSKILHLVRYSDGEEEYLSDSVTLEKWPEKVSEMYQRNILTNDSISDEQKNKFNLELKNTSFVEKVAAAIKNRTKTAESNEMSSLQMETADANIPSICSSINLDSSNNNELLPSEISTDQKIDDTTYTKETFNDLGSSVIAIDSATGPSSSLRDSEFVVHSDTSLSQTFSQSQILPEFEVEVSDDEVSLGSNNCLPDNQEEFENVDEAQNNNSYIYDDYDEEIEVLFDPSPASHIDEDEEFEILFDPSPPPWLFRQNDTHE